MKRKIFYLWSLLLLFPMFAWGQQDMTDYVKGAYGDNEQYWYIVDMSTPVYSQGVATHLQCDTWSSRGGKDGSDMTTPFMEFHRNAGDSNTGSQCNMPAVEIRHQTIEGLPKGKYKLSMFIRCYAELYNGENPPAGVKLYANGVESADVCEGVTLVSYNGGVHATSTPEITFKVGEDGILDFGINVTEDATATELNWISWKDVTLTYIDDGSLQEGDYYVRNKATGEWLQGGGRWGTQLMLGQHGVLVSVTKTGEKTYTMTSEFSNNGLNSLWMSEDEACVYMEASQTIWTIEPALTDDYFTIQSNGFYLGYGDTDVVSIYADPQDNEAQWEFIPRNVRVKQLVEGGSNDATFLIADPRLDRNHNEAEEWAGSGFRVDGINGAGYGNQCAEVWNSTFDVFQVLTDIPNGRYQLRAQGYYRYNDNGENYNLRAREEYEAGNEDILYAQLYALSGDNEVSTPPEHCLRDRQSCRLWYLLW